MDPDPGCQRAHAGLGSVEEKVLMADSDQGRTSLAFGVLGPFEATYDGHHLPLGGRQQRAVLALLVCEASQAVSVDHLIDGVWGDPAPAGAVSSVQTHIFHLRQVLEPDRARGAPGTVLVTVPGGYRLDVDPSCVDMTRFERLTTEGDAALARGDPAAALAGYDAALALWRGDVLAGLADHPFVAHVRARLEEARASALVSRLQAQLDVGHDLAVVAEARALVRDHPLREDLHAQLMLALYRSGRQSDALAAYHQLRSVLDEELGIEPSPRLQELQRRVLTQDPSLDWQPPSVPPPAVPPAVPPPGLPPVAEARPRKSARIGALATAMVLVGTMLGGADIPASPAAAATLSPNTVSELNASEHVVASLPVGTNPVAMASSHGHLWVVNAGDSSVWKIDPSSHTVGQKIDVGKDPRGVVATGDDLWVTSFTDGTVTRINMVDDRQVETVQVGNNPDAIAAGPVGLWVANSGDNTIQRIDTDAVPAVADRAVPVGDGPDGLAVDDRSVWVANGRGASVMRIDARKRSPMTDPIQVGTGPRGIVLAGGDVWVADELSQDVYRIDADTYQTRPVAVGDGPTGLAVHDGSLFVAEKYAGELVRIDLATGEPHRTDLRGALHAVTVVGGRLWVAAGTAAAAGHRGGTLRVATGAMPGTFGGIDPASVYEWVTAHAERNVYDNLLAYHYSSADPQVLVPDLATSVPSPLDGGRTYVFNLRPGVRYSTGREVVASDFRRGVERALHSKIARPDFYAGIVGAPHCIDHPRSCDLRRGVVTDDAAGLVTFHLKAPDPQFLLKLTMLVVPTPPGTPLGELKEPLPGTGPYRISTYVPHRAFTLERNEYFHEWSAGAQPDGFVDRVVWLKVADVHAAAQAVDDGRADLAELTVLGEEGPLAQGLVDQYLVTAPSRLHGNVMQGTGFVVINSAVPPFTDVRVRRAFNYAIDRRRIVQAEGGPSYSETTCQLVPPSMPSYVRYCPYTRGPANGTYRGPDPAMARRLVRASGTSGMTVRVTDIVDDINGAPYLDYLAQVLRSIGYRARVQRLPNTERSERLVSDRHGGVQVQTGGWFADFPVPANFIDLITCSGGGGYVINYCDPDLDRRVARATAELQVDPAAALRAFTAIDHEVTDRAVLAPVTNLRNWWLTSPRVGNYQNDIRDYGPLTSLLWVH